MFLNIYLKHIEIIYISQKKKKKKKNNPWAGQALQQEMFCSVP